MEDDTMKEGNKFLKRCLALVLTAVLLLSNLSGLSTLVDAADEVETSTTVGQIVANNYNLTEAEKAILASGYLVSDTFTYVAPTAGDNLVAVDTENAKITAASKDGWKPVSAVIVYGDNELEVELVNGEATYDAAKVGNAFSVKVTYQLTTTVSEDVQTQLLNAPAYLKQGVANLDAVAGQNGNLYVLEEALPTLVDVAENGLDFGPVKFDLPDSAVAAIQALNEQYVANNGLLNLSVMINEYNQTAKTGYLLTKGAGVHTEVNATCEHISAIATWMDSASAYFDGLDETTKSQLNMLHGVIGGLRTALSDAAAADWTAANLGSALVYADANYTALDALVAALGETTTGLTVTEELLVATTVVQANMSMWNVTVNVKLNAVNAENVVAQYGETKTVVLTLADGATKAEIEAAVKQSGVEAEAIAAWGAAYVEGKYLPTVTALPDTLTGDITYTITYNPVEYTVTIAGEDAEYPYGYKLTLPKHTDSTKAYDYYDENGNYVPQGTVITVTGNATYTRTEGAAYVEGSLLGIIAENAGNSKLTAILSSGALLLDETVNYREPSDPAGLVTLSGNTLTASTYASDYEGLSWAPYSYAVDGNAPILFNGATTVTIAGDFEKVTVTYRLTLTNHTAADVQEILDKVDELVADASAQKNVLDALAGYTDDMGSFNKTKFAGLISAIEYANISDEMKEYFTPIVTSIVNLCFDTNGYLKLYNMLIAYSDESTGGLVYYYQNSAAFQHELGLLSGYLMDMLDSEEKLEALKILMNDAGVPQYIDKVSTLGESLEKLNNDLTAPDAVIDVTNFSKLDKLVDGLTMTGDLSGVTAQTPYLELEPITKTADKFASVEVKVVIDGKTYTIPAVTVVKGEALTAAQADQLKAAVEEIITANIGNNGAYYTNDYNNGASLDDLVGEALNGSKVITYTWTARNYTVKIEGAEDQTVNINDLTIDLPQHPTPGYIYEYTIGSKVVTGTSYKFTLEELDTLFTNNYTYTITRVETNQAVKDLEAMVEEINKSMGYEAVTLTEENGVYTGVVVNLDVSGLVDFVMGLTGSNFEYIGLNGEGLMYFNEETAGLEVSVQTLINAILNDNAFGSETLITLGEKGKGVLLNASLQLGDSAAQIVFEDLDFTINVTSVPSQLVTAANALAAVRNYVSFHSENGVLVVDLNLPDAVYGAYLTALIGTGNVDKADVNSVNQAIAFQFLYDYFEAVITSDMDAETFTNTIKLLGRDYDLTKYNDYYEYFCSFMNGDSTTVEINEAGASLSVSVAGKAVFDNLLKLIGRDPADLSMYLAMIKEYKSGNIEGTVKATLKNPSKSYNAMIVDVNASGLTNKYACTSSYSALANKTANLAGYSAILLLGDVDGDLTISGTTILDLNGKTINGNVTATGTLYIIDSSMDTYVCGGITGTVSGNVVILGGNYNSDVSAYLKAGYYQDGIAVRNELYHIESVNGNVTFVINTDIIDSSLPSVKALALDIAADLVLNYATSAALTVGGNGVYDVKMDDLLGLLNSDSKVDDLILKVLDSIDVPGISGMVNMMLADLIDFAAIEEALASGTALATYDLTTAPWHVSLDHITDGNYLSVSIVSNPDLAKTFSVSLKLEGSHTGYLEDLAGELKNIVDALRTEITVNFQQPTYADKNFNIVGSGSAIAVIDLSNNEDYATLIGVILAYGNPDKAEAVVAALTAGDMDALKAVIDDTTVAEVFTALKVMSRNVDFAAMAEQVGVTASESACEVEEIFHLLLCAAGKALEELEITGNNAKLGSLYTENGWYELTYDDIFRSGEYSVRSYSALFNLTAEELTLKVKLFGKQDHVHEFGEWITVDEPDCVNPGEERRYCACGEYESREIPATGHEPADEWVIVKAPTTEEEGWMELYCKHCGELLDGKAIPKLNPPKTGDYMIMIIGTLALIAVMGLAVVEFGFKRRLLK